MTRDIKITWDPEDMTGDMSVTANDLTEEDGLETAVLISIFTDRRAAEDDSLPDSWSSNRRGWWGDLVSPVKEGDETGSRRWLLERAKTTADVIPRLKEYDLEALQWMIDDGVAAKIDVEVERQGTPGNDRLAERIKIYRSNGTVALNFENLWEGQLGI